MNGSHSKEMPSLHTTPDLEGFVISTDTVPDAFPVVSP